MCHGRLSIALFSLLFIAACGQAQKDEDVSGGAKKWGSFPVAIYSSSNVNNNSEALSSFQQAMTFWEQQAGKKLFDYKGVYGGQSFSGDPLNPSSIAANVVQFLAPWNYDYSIAGQTVVVSQGSRIQSSIVLINPNVSNCFYSCTSTLKIFTHELGHFLGLNHSSDRQDIMYPEIQPGSSLTGVHIDVNAFLSLVN